MSALGAVGSSMDAALVAELHALRDAGLFRSMARVRRVRGAEIQLDDGRLAIDFASNDYLGLAADARVAAAAREALASEGAGVASARLVTGNHALHERLERDIADFKRVESALLFPTGYMANVGSIPALVGRGDVIFSDALNHASLIDGCRLSRAVVRVVPHADPDTLAAMLAAERGRYRRALIVVDSVFSMDGDLFPLDRLVDLARAHDAWTYVDDAHGSGVLGDEGRGATEAFGVEGEIDILMGTLGKALGTSGAFVGGSRTLVDYLANRARAFVFTTGSPPAMAAAASEAIRIAAAESWRRDRLFANGARLRAGFSRMRKAFDVAEDPELATPRCAHIVPLVLGDPERTMSVARALRAQGYLVGAIRPPTVPEGTSRLRVTVSAAHTDAHLDGLLGALEDAVRGRPRRLTDTRDARSSSTAGDRTAEAIAEVDARRVWHPYTQHAIAPPPIPVERAEGAWLHAVDGRRILDMISSWWVTLHGHAHPAIADAVARQSRELEQVIFAGFTHEPAARLAAELCRVLPAGLTRVFYSDNGSTAVEVAVKMALQHSHHRGERRTLIAALDNAYHGDTFGAMSVSARGAFTSPFDPHLFEVARLPDPSGDGASDDGTTLLAGFDALIAERGDELAAVIVEPMLLGAGGMRVWAASALRALRERAAEHGILFIADEVLTGFGRTGPLFACEAAGITPDIICLSKGLTGGFLPLGATVAREEIFAGFLSRDRRRTFFHGHSYTANPVACAAARASLALLDDACSARRRSIEQWHRDRLPRLALHPAVRRPRVLGTVAAFDLENAAAGGASLDTRTRSDYLDPVGPRLAAFALEHGVLIRPLGNVVYLLPPYCVTEEEIALAYDVVARFLEQSC